MEINGIWTENHRVEANMVDSDRDITWSAIANIFQNAAGNHANFRQLGFYALREKGMVWVLNRLIIKVLDTPAWLDTLRLESWVSAMQPFSHRHFALFHANTDKPMVYGYSMWIPIDIVSHKPRRIPPSEFDILLLTDKAKGCQQPEKLAGFAPNTEGGVLSSERQVRFSELDLAGHVNNARYVEWLFDDLCDQGKVKGCKELTVNYLGETFLGDSIQVFSKKIENQIDYVVKNAATQNDVLRAKMSF
jgi:medium-chain acyl-[acyl-carrier-protein] hydrolase